MKLDTRIVFMAMIMILPLLSFSQNHSSLIGFRAGYKTGALLGKIYMNDKNALEGTIGVITPQEEYTVGAGVAYHRIVYLNERENFELSFGPGIKGVLGDVTTGGVHFDLGLDWIYRRINIGVDVSPTFFFDEELGFRPLYGLHLRLVNF